MDYELSYYIGKYRRRLLIGTITIIVLLIGLVAYYNIQLSQQRQGKLPVPVEVVPRDAMVKLSTGEELTSRGTAYIAPGNYKVTVSKDGFETQTRDLRVSPEAFPYVYIGLSGASDEARAWVKDHRSDFKRLELMTIEKGREYNTLVKSNNPVINVLPIKDPYYTIDYKNYDDKSIELIIYGTAPRYRQAALDFLHKKGYDPTDFRITYENYINPLEEN